MIRLTKLHTATSTLISALFSVALVMTSVSAIAAPVTLQEATAKAQKKFGGEVIKTEVVEKNGRPAYAIRILTNGRVKQVLIDQKNGRVLSPAKE